LARGNWGLSFDYLLGINRREWAYWSKH